MEVNVNQAIKIFISKSSFEMIYMEAFANDLDANATQFNVSVRKTVNLMEQRSILNFA